MPKEREREMTFCFFLCGIMFSCESFLLDGQLVRTQHTCLSLSVTNIFVFSCSSFCCCARIFPFEATTQRSSGGLFRVGGGFSFCVFYVFFVLCGPHGFLFWGKKYTTNSGGCACFSACVVPWLFKAGDVTVEAIFTPHAQLVVRT